MENGNHWHSPVNDPAFPNDYFLFTVVSPIFSFSKIEPSFQSDNDFLSTRGVALRVPFNAGLDVDNQFLVFRVTLPSVVPGSVQQSIGI